MYRLQNEIFTVLESICPLFALRSAILHFGTARPSLEQSSCQSFICAAPRLYALLTQQNQ